MKLILCILFVLLFREDVFAKTYYSDYSEFTEYSIERVESSDIVNVESKKIYNKYFDVAEGGYYLMGENPSYYPYINVNIYKSTEFTEWSTVYPEDKYSRIIEHRKNCIDEECLTYYLEFRYKDRLYYHYQEYTQQLAENSSLKGYIKDEDDYTEYYRYQKRDKLEIEDNIIITSIDEKLDKFITCTTKYQVEGEIDYSKNGMYEVNIFTDFAIVPIQVQVLIVNNVEKKYNNLLKNKDVDIQRLHNDLKISLKNVNSLEIENQQLQLTNKYIRQELERKDELYKSCENDLFNLEEISKVNHSNLANQLEDSLNELLALQSNVLNKENNIYQLKQEISELQEQLNVNNTNIEQHNDNLKKLELCEKVNSSLNIKVENTKKMNQQNTFYIIFISTLLFLIMCALLKIKSREKMN